METFEFSTLECCTMFNDNSVFVTFMSTLPMQMKLTATLEFNTAPATFLLSIPGDLDGFVKLKTNS